MIGEWQTINSQVPSEWVNIDEAGGNYQISNIGTIRKICKSKAKGVYYREMRLDGNNVRICKIKYNIPRLLSKYFWAYSN